jgi:diacylglycerol kinase family enzyme
MALDTTATGQSACATQTKVIAAALLHPNIPPQSVGPFESAAATIAVQESLEEPRHFDAALIFGGDGTIHRHLPQLQQTRIPALIVPRGSGNDFAKSLP